ncbi:acyl-CoA desaturase [Chroococcus sp. FPU101]|uniref:acyl-CoA desaturase n=1 Tax=Chroococcus sp. FPU101 TaxID=1974212 RepID=UPI001A8DB0ED|nr:acyl-CoA desaturase [Chroococcus sp. FPU101]GFE69989.1 fatty acid desaturase [Chroococcus sp. FPU101]
MTNSSEKQLTSIPISVKPTMIAASDSIRAIKRRFILSLCSISLLGLGVAIYQIFSLEVTRLSVIIFLVMYILCGLGITVGFHRYFAHRTFKTTRFIEICLAILGSMSAQGSVVAWVSVHRCHHQYSDLEGDPHSPHLKGEGIKERWQGLWHSHLGWLLDDKLPNSMIFAKDLIQDSIIVQINRLYIFWIVLGVLIPSVLEGILTWSWYGAFQGFIWGGIARLFFSFHGGYTINSIAHLFGQRPFVSKDQSRNNFWLALPTLGEGWHNNHHAFPNSARFGLQWWQIDLGYGLIWILKRCGLIWEVKVPNIGMIEAKLVKVS